MCFLCSPSSFSLPQDPSCKKSSLNTRTREKHISKLISDVQTSEVICIANVSVAKWYFSCLTFRVILERIDIWLNRNITTAWPRLTEHSAARQALGITSAASFYIAKCSSNTGTSKASDQTMVIPRACWCIHIDFRWNYPALVLSWRRRESTPLLPPFHSIVFTKVDSK